MTVTSMIAKQLTMAMLGFFLVACSDPTAIIHERSENSESSVTKNVCLSQSPCKLSEHLSLYLGSARVEPETEFVIQLETNTKVEVKSAWLEGENMNMGRIPVFFDDSLTASAMVGMCSDPKMRWLLRLDVVVNGQAQLYSQPIIVSYQ
ncbi:MULTISPECIES: hypothetical protein [unclassified Pseudoalteromonas]|uniref:hypothetical protein n=1 Tax=unclassified Pseudoalteromonas TaxID=194690 RepID=UPI003014E34D